MWPDNKVLQYVASLHRACVKLSLYTFFNRGTIDCGHDSEDFICDSRVWSGKSRLYKLCCCSLAGITSHWLKSQNYQSNRVIRFDLSRHSSHFMAKLSQKCQPKWLLGLILIGSSLRPILCCHCLLFKLYNQYYLNNVQCVWCSLVFVHLLYSIVVSSSIQSPSGYNT